MKFLKCFALIVLSFNVSTPLSFAGVPTCMPERVTYSPANPMIGQVVTFVICGSDCYDYGIYPSQDQSPVNLLSAINGTGMNANYDTVYYTFTAPGTYHIGLDRQDNGSCTNVAALPVTGANSWFMGPLGGTSVGAVQIGTTGIFCVPLTIAAAPGPGIAEIPTIGQWGLMVLGLLLVITGVVAFWHKRAFANH